MLPNSCFLIGRRDADEGVYSALLEMIEKVITEDNITEFYVGHHGHFDRLAARAVMEARLKYPDIRLYLAQPYPRRLFRLPKGFDGAFCPPGHRLRDAQRCMIDRVRCLIADAYRRDSHSYRLLQYARGRAGLRVENLMQPLLDKARALAHASASMCEQKN